MAKNVNNMANEVNDFLRRRATNICSFNWNDFYKFSDRQKIKESFKNQLQIALKAFNLQISFGDYAVVIHRDENFSATKVASDGTLAATE